VPVAAHDVHANLPALEAVPVELEQLAMALFERRRSGA
jgi:hypothetical protein